LTLAALFGFSPLVLFRRKSWIRRYIATIALFLSAIVFVGWLSTAYADMVYGIDSIFGILTNLSILPIITLALWAVVVGWTIYARKHTGNQRDEIGKTLVNVWIGLIVAIVAVVLYVLYDANIAGNAEKYAAIKNYVVFDDTWGTNRGYVWTRSLMLYDEVLTPVQKVFGYGADTFKLLMMQYFPPRENIVYDSAHNEYLQFLVTIGFVGMVSYIAIFVSSIALMAKRMKDRPEVTALLFVVLAYATQATVNIYLPVVFPVIWQLLAMGLSRLSEEAVNNN